MSLNAEAGPGCVNLPTGFGCMLLMITFSTFLEDFSGCY